MTNLFATMPVKIRQVDQRADEKEEKETLEKINRFALRPFASMEEIFQFSGYASNDRMDSFFTRMDAATTLKNYARDLQNGVPLLPAHDIHQSPYGRSYDGSLEGERAEDGGTSVRGSWYIPRDMAVNGENTNDAIKRIQSGIQKDLSVGFGGNDLYYKCGTCGRDLLFDPECEHFPGLPDEKGETTFAWIMNGELREVSTVYKGSAPGAFIDKAREFASQGELPAGRLQTLERAYGTDFSDGKKRFYVPGRTSGNENKEGKHNMNILEQLRQEISENKIDKERVYAILDEDGEPFRQRDDIAIRNELGRGNTTPEAIRSLKKEAEHGRRYIADMIDETVKARVKVQGDTFSAEQYRSMLKNSADVDFIQSERESYEKQAAQRFTAGRQTSGNNEGGSRDGGEVDDDTTRQPENLEDDNFFAIEGGRK